MVLTTLSGEVLPFFHHSSQYNHPPSPFFLSLQKPLSYPKCFQIAQQNATWWSEAHLNFGGVGYHFWMVAPSHIKCKRRI